MPVSSWLYLGLGVGGEQRAKCWEGAPQRAGPRIVSSGGHGYREGDGGIKINLPGQPPS